MKKIIFLFIISICAFMIIGCNNTKKGVITWSGVEQLQVTAGDKVDLKQGISIVDSIDGDITSNVIILNDKDHFEELEEQGFIDDYYEFDSSLAGFYVVFYRVENSTGVKEYKQRDVFVYPGHNVVNGDFSKGIFGWTFDRPGGEATFSVGSDKIGTVTITNAGVEWWALQLMQTVSLKSGVTYKTTIVAKSPEKRSLSFSYEDAAESYKMLMGGVVVQQLDTEYEEYTWYYTADKAYTSAKAVIYLGYQLETDSYTSNPHIINIQSVYTEIVEVCPNIAITVPANLNLTNGSYTFNPEETDKTLVDLQTGVSAVYESEDITGNVKILGKLPRYILANTDYIISYLVEGENGKVSFVNRKITISFIRENPYEIINGDFSEGMAAWTADVNQTAGTGVARFTANEQGGLDVTVTQSSSARWHIQMFQSGLSFDAANTYVITIRLKADVEREATLEIANTSAGAIPITKLDMTVTTDYTDYTLIWTPDQNYDSARIGFQCGDASSSIESPAVFNISSIDIQLQE